MKCAVKWEVTVFVRRNHQMAQGDNHQVEGPSPENVDSNSWGKLSPKNWNTKVVKVLPSGKSYPKTVVNSKQIWGPKITLEKFEPHRGNLPRGCM